MNMDGVATLGPPTPPSRSPAPVPAQITGSMPRSPFLATRSGAYSARHLGRPFRLPFSRAAAARARPSHNLTHTARNPAAPCLTARPLQPCAAFPTAFNNTAVQFVRVGALIDAGEEDEEDWWTLPPPTAAATAPSDRGTTTGETSSTNTVDKVQPAQLPRGAGSIGASATSAPRSAKPATETPG